MTVSRTQRIGVQESAEAKPQRRYKNNSYICDRNRLTSIAIQSVTAIKITFQSRDSK